MVENQAEQRSNSGNGQGFRERTQRFMARAVDAAGQWYDREGEWLADTTPPHTRERYWLAGAMYAAGEAEWADAIVAKGETEKYGAIRFNIFNTNIAASLLVAHRDKMSAAVRQELERLVRDGFSFKPGNRQPDFQFHGYNDNMPAKATVGLILGGEMLGCEDAVDYGLWNLRQFRAMLVRNGINSEFNSPTYSGLTIRAMGEIAAQAQNEEARLLASGIEQRLWIDLAARFHPEMGVLAGPYSRAYTVDTAAHASCISSLLWFCLGDRVHPSPMLLFDKPDDLVLHHMGDVPFNVAQFCWFAGGHYDIPDTALRLFDAKPFPFRAVASCELGAGEGTDFLARTSRIETVLHRDFALGTSSAPFGSMDQNNSYFVTYKRQDQVESYRDIGTIFTKLAVNGDVPGTKVRARDGDREYANVGEADILSSWANTFTIQSGSTALVLTHPHPSFDEAAARKPLSAIREQIILSTHGGDVEELIVGGIPRKDWSGEVQHGEWIVCRTGKLLSAFRPMVYTPSQRPVSIRLESKGNYNFICSSLYEGEERSFARDELRFLFGGFVAEHASVSEYASLAEFAEEFESAQFTDYYWTTRRVRYRRPAGKARPPLELETSWSPGAMATRYATINGARIEQPIAAIDGVTSEELPFLNEPFASIPSFFPWEDLTVAWGEWPSAIGDREE
ncbi:hypothetical protein B8V81_3867 [Paenibacillus pasadenensis]|uniref:Uncharacterized protein n=1 Tax=Paenibacillus pasadenensis TaxID=217090 RepID=A0A2N5N504_9BACL|nr:MULTISPECIES: hypothetical protein [Paenibacillus]PLT45436.1 hypothetical protein B8V81_3867 [Paenibacillus pasadenensis]QGG55923.1 hypothetical protein GE073_10280 [Paenibacillus sp. B01]